MEANERLLIGGDQALRALGNHLVAILHGCLRHHTPYDETLAWANQTKINEAAA
jgi:hypothetical protein